MGAVARVAQELGPVRAMVAVAILGTALFIASSVLVRETWCDAWGWPMTRLAGDDSVYVDPRTLAVEVGPGCFDVPWWAA